MAQKQMLKIDVEGGQLACAHWPGEGPDLILVHGISASHLAWMPVIRSLPQNHYNIFAPDLRGRGQSNGLPGPFGLRRHVDDLCALIDAVANKPVVFAGHSMGAYIGAVFGASRPDYLSHIALVDGGLALPLPAGITPEALLEKILGPALERLRKTFASRQAYQDYWHQHPAFQRDEDWSDDVTAYFDYDLVGSEPELKSRVLEAAVREDGLDPMKPDMITMVDKVPLPMLITTAVRGLLNQPEPLMPVAAVKAKTEALANLTWEEIADTNHYTITLGSGAVKLAAALDRFYRS